MVSGTVSRMGWSWACVRRSRTRSGRRVSNEAAATISSNAASLRCCEQEQVTKTPPVPSSSKPRAVDLFVSARWPHPDWRAIWRRPEDPAPLGRSGGARRHVRPAARKRWPRGTRRWRSGSPRDCVGPIARLRGRAVHRFHRLALRRQMQRKTAGGCETIQGPAPRVASSGQVIFALVEENAGLLAMQKIGVEQQSVHFHRDRLRRLACQHSRYQRQVFAFPNRDVVSLDNPLTARKFL